MAQMNRTNQAILTSKDVDRKVKRIKTFVLEKRVCECRGPTRSPNSMWCCFYMHLFPCIRIGRRRKVQRRQKRSLRPPTKHPRMSL